MHQTTININKINYQLNILKFNEIKVETILLNLIKIHLNLTE